MKEKTKMSELISRSRTNNYSVDEDGNIVGVPIVFDEPCDIGGVFEEVIERGAVTNDLLKDVCFIYNHDENCKPLARTRNGTLKLNIENDGVHMNAKINRNRSDANDLYLAIQDGDIDAMSFRFRIAKQRWENLRSKYPRRVIEKIGYIQEVSAVNEPAYAGTSINARSASLLDSEKQALDEARAKLVDTDKKNDLELEKLKAKYLYNL